MVDLTPLPNKLLDLRRRTLTLLAERSEDEVSDAGLIGLVGSIQIALAAIDEEEPDARAIDGIRERRGS